MDKSPNDKALHEKLKNHEQFNKNMSKSKGWTLLGSLLRLWMDENSSQQSNKNR